MGGSFASIGDEASAFARFHFRPHFHQHAGIRLVRPADPPPEGDGGKPLKLTKLQQAVYDAAVAHADHATEVLEAPKHERAQAFFERVL